MIAWVDALAWLLVFLQVVLDAFQDGFRCSLWWYLRLGLGAERVTVILTLPAELPFTLDWAPHNQKLFVHV